MTPEVFAEWLRRQGHKVLKTECSYWYDQGPGVLQAFPYHWEISPSESEIRDLLVRKRWMGLRYSTSLTSPYGALSYHAVLEAHSYSIDDLGKWARKNVRRGLKRCRVEPVSFDRLADEGWGLQLDTLARQGRQVRLEREIWSLRCLAARDLPGFDAWGAMVDERLAASVISFQMEDCGYLLYQQSQREYLVDFVNNALAFVVTQHLLGLPGIKRILYGLHSLDAPASIDEFKFRMGYTAKAVRQRVVFHPWIAPAFNPGTHALLKEALRLFPGHPVIAKSEGMLRFYLQGKHPLEHQPLPPGLSREARSYFDER